MGYTTQRRISFARRDSMRAAAAAPDGSESPSSNAGTTADLGVMSLTQRPTRNDLHATTYAAPTPLRPLRALRDRGAIQGRYCRGAPRGHGRGTRSRAFTVEVDHVSAGADTRRAAWRRPDFAAGVRLG